MGTCRGDCWERRKAQHAIGGGGGVGRGEGDQLEVEGFVSSGGLRGAGEKAGSKLESSGWDKIWGTPVSS